MLRVKLVVRWWGWWGWWWFSVRLWVGLCLDWSLKVIVVAISSWKSLEPRESLDCGRSFRRVSPTFKGGFGIGGPGGDCAGGDEGVGEVGWLGGKARSQEEPRQRSQSWSSSAITTICNRHWTELIAVEIEIGKILPASIRSAFEKWNPGYLWLRCRERPSERNQWDIEMNGHLK